MAYDARAIANYFLDLAARDGKTLNPMKIQKLVYNAHGICLAIHDKPLIDEAIEAWTYGPVVPSLYHEFKQYGSGEITGKATKWKFGSNPGRAVGITEPSIDDSPNRKENQETKDLLEAVWESYGDLSAVQLSNLTHEPGTPWSVTASQNPGRKGVDIPDSLMKAWFGGSGA